MTGPAGTPSTWPLGAFPTETGTMFRLWTTQASRAAVVLSGDGPDQTVPLEPVGDGVFERLIEGVGAGRRYTFELDGQPVPDPYARCLPDGVHAPAEVWAPAGGERPVAPDLKRSDLVIYELHVGTFTPEGTFRAAQERLPYLRELGVTAVELMPLASFPGQHGWGYDGVALYAPFAAYGRPDDLMRFIDEAHRQGLVVLLDLVLNHFGPDGNYLSAYSPEYFTDRHKTPWGDALNYSNPWMRRLALDAARHWLETYRFDGLRLDATHEIFDDSELHVLHELAQQVHQLRAELGTRHFLFCEDDRNRPELVTETGMDGMWADDFHHQLRVLLTGERDGYYRAYVPKVTELARCINRGWLYEGQDWPLGTPHPRGSAADRLDASSFVYCIQNHDQIGNRALGDRLQQVAGTEAFLAASTLLLFLPMTPLLFQGQEWMTDSRFQYFSDHNAELGALITEGRLREFQHFETFSAALQGEAVPDPQDPATFQHSHLDWPQQQEGEHARALELYRRLLALRRQDPVLRHSGRPELQAGAQGPLLWVTRRLGDQVRALVLNFSSGPVALPDLQGSGARLLLASSPDADLGHLPGQTAAVLALSSLPDAWTGAPGPDEASRPRAQVQQTR
ncbi:malto-oligosyltrehalose trehalohydrolase [Deinococcus sonorensis]|uniref:Malto-oligosyltrehalose trehalohydrolase n=2 Tax=Deinococcus sonorensis TaxID=309891 RepID=A0AAU7UEB0_9DEIO